MKFRRIEEACPKCKKQGLEAIEIIDSNVAGYRCSLCSSEFDAELFHDWENKKHYWIGKLRNPEYWKLNNKSIVDGLTEMLERDKKGIKEYLGIYIIEEIK